MIGLNDFARQWQDAGEDAVAAFRETGESGWYILGQEVVKFEEALATCFGVPIAVGVASGLDAIEIALRAAGCRAGDKVLTTPVSAFATTLPILKLGAVPVFTSVDKYGLIDLDAAEAVLKRDPLIRFFVPVHLYGHALDLSRLERLHAEYGVVIIEDCAQSIGACFQGRSTGSVGHAAAISFYPTKNLGAMGEGGAVLCKDRELADVVRMLRDYGQSAKYLHDSIGYNSRLDEVQAAILRRAGLPRLRSWTERRREIAHRYLERMHNTAVLLPGAPPGSNSCWHLFPALVDPRQKAAFRDYLHHQGVASGEHYPIAIPDQQAMNGMAFEWAGDIEGARTFCRSQVSLPIHPYLTDAEIATVIAAVNSWTA